MHFTVKIDTSKTQESVEEVFGKFKKLSLYKCIEKWFDLENHDKRTPTFNSYLDNDTIVIGF